MEDRPTVRQQPQEEDVNKFQVVEGFEEEIQLKLAGMANEQRAIREAIVNTQKTIQTLSETLATHVRQNIDTTSEIRDYIGEQMAYRLYRQNLEENNLQLKLAQKELELEYAEKRLNSLEEEKKTEDAEETSRELEMEKQRLEIENLRRNLDAIQHNKHSTKDKLKAITSVETPFQKKVRETLVLTALGTLTASGVGGIIALVVWFVRFYIQNNP